MHIVRRELVLDWDQEENDERDVRRQPVHRVRVLREALLELHVPHWNGPNYQCRCCPVQFCIGRLQRDILLRPRLRRLYVLSWSHDDRSCRQKVPQARKRCIQQRPGVPERRLLHHDV